MDGCQSHHQDPLPSLPIVDKSRQNGCKKTAPGEEKAIKSYISTSFVGEVLGYSEQFTKEVARTHNICY